MAGHRSPPNLPLRDRILVRRLLKSKSLRARLSFLTAEAAQGSGASLNFWRPLIGSADYPAL
jgi:hypothetical protein